MNFNDDAIVSIKANDYRIHFWYVSKDDAINIMNSSSLDKKVNGTTYYERNKEVILNRAKDYYENNKEVLRQRAKNKYRKYKKQIS